jgi:hypothetical protein
LKEEGTGPFSFLCLSSHVLWIQLLSPAATISCLVNFDPHPFFSCSTNPVTGTACPFYVSRELPFPVSWPWILLEPLTMSFSIQTTPIIGLMDVCPLEWSRDRPKVGFHEGRNCIKVQECPVQDEYSSHRQFCSSINKLRRSSRIVSHLHSTSPIYEAFPSSTDPSSYTFFESSANTLFRSPTIYCYFLAHHGSSFNSSGSPHGLHASNPRTPSKWTT